VTTGFKQAAKHSGSKDLLFDKAVQPATMRQRIIGLRQLRISSWLLAGLFLTSVFLINNRQLVSGARVQIWDAWSFYASAFSLVADHARSGWLLLWDPWLAAGTPDFADPQVAAASPIAIIAGSPPVGTPSRCSSLWCFLGGAGVRLAVFIRHMPSTQLFSILSRSCPGSCNKVSQHL
jgi:hypothetical protein